VMVRRSEPAPQPVALPPCHGAAAKIADSWSPARATAVRSRLAAARTPWASDTGERVVHGLDGWTARWGKVRRDACEATLVRAEQSEAMLARINGCLDRSQIELDALIAVLAEADDAVAERAVVAVAELRPPESCRTPDADAPAAPPEAAAKVTEIGRQVARAQALYSAGRYAESADVARAASAVADQLGHKPAIAEAHFYLGRALRQKGDQAGAMAALEEAQLAAIASRMDALACEATGVQIELLGTEMGKPAEATELARRAEALAQRSGDPLAIARIDISYASVLRAQAKFDDARPRFERGLQTLRAQPGQELQVAGVLNNIGVLLVAQGRYQEALDKFREVLTIRERIMGADHPLIGGLLVNIGAMQTHTGKFADALATLQRGRVIMEAKLGGDHPNLAKLINNIGFAHARAGQWQQALPYHRDALAMWERLKQADQIAATATLINLALAERRLGHYDEALAVDRRTLAIYEKAYGTDQPDIAYPLEGIGETLLLRGKPAEALAPLQRARALREKHEVDIEERGHTRYLLARALWDANRDRKAAVALADQAHADYLAAVKQNPQAAADQAELESWRTTHGGQTPGP
jgi:eukaryotic-like serine/threonine-protein kinase